MNSWYSCLHALNHDFLVQLCCLLESGIILSLYNIIYCMVNRIMSFIYCLCLLLGFTVSLVWGQTLGENKFVVCMGTSYSKSYGIRSFYTCTIILLQIMNHDGCINVNRLPGPFE